MRYFLLLLIAAVFIPGCGKDKNFDYSLTGVVKNARSLQPISGVDIAVSQQLLSGGTFNQNFNFLASTTTDGSGNYTLEFPRENAVAYRFDASADEYIPRSFEFDQDDFEIDEPKAFNFSLYPEAFVEVHLSNQLPSTVSDVFSFRFDDADFDCQCCNEEWKVIEGSDADTTFSCRLYGDTWLHYVTHLVAPETDTLIVDSLWCPAFQTSFIDIDY
ncbi:MAG: carboxypeptidase regulatory-like domain-containing protein [Flavobacteriales bacterium]|nr:carboxypeptidase regulatory-like domain-containing protein [Flavobacteriales bacterium]